MSKFDNRYSVSWMVICTYMNYIQKIQKYVWYVTLWNVRWYGQMMEYSVSKPRSAIERNRFVSVVLYAWPSKHCGSKLRTYCDLHDPTIGLNCGGTTHFHTNKCPLEDHSERHVTRVGKSCYVFVRFFSGNDAGTDVLCLHSHCKRTSCWMYQQLKS